MSSAHALTYPARFSPAISVTPVVFVVDDDPLVRKSLELLIQSQGWRAEIFESAEELFDRPRPQVPSCLVLDVSLRGTNGLDVQTRASREWPEMPVIFISGFEHVPTTVKAMKAGAVDFLTKPFNNNALIASIRESLHRSRVLLDRHAELHAVRSRYTSLTPRERQVMSLVVTGLLNKQVGGELGISEITVKAHRGQVMQKMKANSLADLVRMAGRLGAPQQVIHLADQYQRPIVCPR